MGAVPEARHVRVRGDGAVARLAQHRRQAGHLAPEPALEEHRVLRDRVAAEHLELGVGGVAAEDGGERQRLAGLGPELAERRRKGILRHPFLAEDERVEERLEHDHVHVARPDTGSRTSGLPGQRDDVRRRAHQRRQSALDLALGRRPADLGERAHRFLGEVQGEAAALEVLRLVPDRVAEARVERIAHRLRVQRDEGRGHRDDAERGPRTRRSPAHQQGREQEGRGEDDDHGHPRPAFGEVEDVGEVDEIVGAGRRAEHRELGTVAELEGDDQVASEQQCAAHAPHQREGDQRDGEVARVVGKPERVVEPGVERDGDREAHRPGQGEHREGEDREFAEQRRPDRSGAGPGAALRLGKRRSGRLPLATRGRHRLRGASRAPSAHRRDARSRLSGRRSSRESSRAPAPTSEAGSLEKALIRDSATAARYGTLCTTSSAIQNRVSMR